MDDICGCLMRMGSSKVQGLRSVSVLGGDDSGTIDSSSNHCLRLEPRAFLEPVISVCVSQNPTDPIRISLLRSSQNSLVRQITHKPQNPSEPEGV